MALSNKLDQEVLSLFCDEVVFRIVLDICLQKGNEFRDIIPMLGRFHTAKCIELCIGKYIQGSSIEKSLRETQIFNVNVADAVLNETNYSRLLKGYLILVNAIENSFLKHIGLCEFREFSKASKAFQIALASKNPEKSKSSYHVSLN